MIFFWDLYLVGLYVHLLSKQCIERCNQSINPEEIYVHSFSFINVHGSKINNQRVRLYV
ncbi:hypothetical protein Pint_13691 [Pistacia integerrima]|uniref:Uncharacterized protein n=1 Tax=Pistacia integerrima TaxID=434235 RepID=A0ACC0Y7Q0_9ROSI|nr:hypothetical protein Pint_13691 [Pistacia integerrima]